MKAVIRIYLILVTVFLIGTLAVATALKLQTKKPVAPTAPKPQKAQEASTPPITTDLVGFKIKIQGLVQQGPATINAKITVFPIPATDSVLGESTVAFQRNTDGTYYGTMSMTTLLPATPSAALVKVLVKAEKHLQRSFAINLISGSYADLTSKLLEAGDIPTPQNGKIDTRDIDYIKSKIFTSDTAADLNYDGIVNAGDLSLIADTLSVKMDEE